MKSLCFLSLILICTSCTHRMLTRDEWVQVGQKNYSNVTKEQLIKGAEKVLYLADGDDFSFQERANGFTGQRKWLVYVLISATMGTDYWNFDVEEKNGKLVASLSMSRNSGSVTGYSVNNQAGSVTSPTMGQTWQGTALYDIFWSRLDYALGLRNDWLDCPREDGKIDSKETWGSIEPLCFSVNVSDNLPDDLSDAEVARIFAPTSHLDDPKYSPRYIKYMKTRVQNHR